MKKSILFFNFFVSIFFINSANAISCKGIDCYENIKNKKGKSVYIARKDNTIEAFEELKAMEIVSPDDTFRLEAAAISASAGTLGALAYAGYATYKQKMEAAAIAAKVAREQSRILAIAIKNSFAVELQILSQELIRHNSNLASKGLAQLTGKEASAYIAKGLESPAVKEKIISNLTKYLSKTTTGLNQAKELAKGVFHIAIRDGVPVISSLWQNTVKSISLGIVNPVKLGISFAETIALSTNQIASRFTTKKILAEIIKNGGKGLLNGCKMFGKNLLTSRALAILGSGWATGAFILLDSSDLSDGTMTGLYRAHPAKLLELDPERAQAILLKSSSIRNSFMALYDLVKETENEGSVSYDHGQCSLQDDEYQTCG